MARIRTVKPELFSNPKLAVLSIEKRYFFVGLISQADDAGRLQDSPRMLIGALFPHDNKVTERKVDTWLNDLARVNSIIRYQVSTHRYIGILGWDEHQKISHPGPSRFPAYHQNGSGMIPEEIR